MGKPVKLKESWDGGEPASGSFVQEVDRHNTVTKVKIKGQMRLEAGGRQNFVYS